MDSIFKSWFEQISSITALQVTPSGVDESMYIAFPFKGLYSTLGRYIRADVVQQRLADHVEVARLHCVVGHVQDEEVNGRLGGPQLGWRGCGLGSQY